MKPIGIINTQFSNTDDEQKLKIKTLKVDTLIDLKYMIESSEDEKQDKVEEIETDEEEVIQKIIMSNYMAYPCMMPMVNAGKNGYLQAVL
jgi:hypothetical protein